METKKRAVTEQVRQMLMNESEREQKAKRLQAQIDAALERRLKQKYSRLIEQQEDYLQLLRTQITQIKRQHQEQQY